MSEVKNIRSPYTGQRIPREHMLIHVKGTQTVDAATDTFLTANRNARYEAGVTADTGQDISAFYKQFAISLSPPGGAPTVVQNVTVKLKLGKSNWQDCPGTFSSNGGATITAGELVFVTLPMTGIRLKLVVNQPEDDTDMQINVLMSGADVKANH